MMLFGKQAVLSVALQLPALSGSFRKMLLRALKSLFCLVRVGMLRDVAPLNRRMYLNSLPPKKKSLSLIIGPPREKPKSLKRSVGFATPVALLMKELASSLSLRRYSKALPWNLFSPLRVTMLIEAPAFRPYSAEKLEVLMLTSRMKSMPMLLTWLLLLPESRLKPPSTDTRFWLPGVPLLG